MKTKNPFKIGERVCGYGILACVHGTVIGISENPPAVQVCWDNSALHFHGAPGRWEEIYNVQSAGNSPLCGGDTPIHPGSRYDCH